MNKRKLFIIFIMIVFIVSVETASIAVIKGTVNTETVRVRKEATTDSSIVKLVSIGEKITVTGESGEWYKVKIDDVTGYIRKDLLDLDEDYPSNNGSQNEELENNDKPSENDNSNGNEIANENSGAGDNTGENVGQGQEVNGENNNQGENAGENNGNNAGTGNENAENPNKIQETTMGEDKTISIITLNEQEKIIGAKKKLQSDVKLKILPLVNSNNILLVTADAEVTIVEIMNSWCKVETAEGETGWIRIDQ